MKHHGLALLIHPYKNILIKRDKLKRLLDDCTQKLVELAAAHTHLRFSITLPGYLLQLVDPLLLSRLNELQKPEKLEWLTSGYTEPFLGMSPRWLSGENIKLGIETFNQLVGTEPAGFAPPFSNWEPSVIEALVAGRIHYAVLSRRLLSPAMRRYCGYWITESGGEAMVAIPAHTFCADNAPADVFDWAERTISGAPAAAPRQLLAIEYLLPLLPGKKSNPFAWLAAFAHSLDTLREKYHVALLREFSASAPPLGIQSIAPGLVFKQNVEQTMAGLSNTLYTFDSVGIMQRKMLDVAETLRASADVKEAVPLKKILFFAQDINRYLPNTSSGFTHLRDRFRTFAQMIEIERELITRNKTSGGQIRIADVLKNGTRSIVMSNKNLKAYIDYKNGGQIFELDYLERCANLMAVHNPTPHVPPRIFVAGKSPASFIDYVLDGENDPADVIHNPAANPGDFYNGVFDYTIRKSAASVKTVLIRQGSLSINGKPHPLILEKVYGLEKDKPELSFAYQLSNHTLTAYAFTFAIRLHFALPGVQTHQAEFVCKKESFNRLAWDRISLNDVTEFTLIDKKTGFAITCFTQKPVRVYSFPINQTSPYQGTAVLISLPVSLDGNGAWSLFGKLSCKTIPVKKGNDADVV